MESSLRAVIFGIDQENANFKKLEGFTHALEVEERAVVSCVNSSKLPSWNERAEIAFIESNIDERVNLGLFNKVVVWQNWSPSRIVSLAKRFPNTEFCLAVKSPIHDSLFRESFKKRFGTNEYLRWDETAEVIDLNDCEQLHSNTQKLSDNSCYAFVSCALASDPRFEVEKNIDVVYFGTGINRPGVIEVANALPRDMKIGIHFVENGGPIHPEVCVQYYRRAKVCIHEQVGPMWGEYAVRFGEATAQGCRVVSYAKDFTISDYFKDDLVPEHDLARNLEDAVSKIGEWMGDRREDRARMRKTSPTHVDAYRRISCAFKLLS